MFKTNANFDINIMSIIFQQDCGAKQQSLAHSLNKIVLCI